MKKLIASITATGNTKEEIVLNVLEALGEIKAGEENQNLGRYNFEISKYDE